MQRHDSAPLPTGSSHWQKMYFYWQNVFVMVNHRLATWFHESFIFSHEFQWRKWLLSCVFPHLRHHMHSVQDGEQILTADIHCLCPSLVLVYISTFSPQRKSQMSISPLMCHTHSIYKPFKLIYFGRDNLQSNWLPYFGVHCVTLKPATF